MSNLQQMKKCKLCNEREVGSQESHIIPYFLTKTLYFKDGKNKGMKTIKLAKQIMEEVEDKWQQDGLKEKYIFCGECEKYFELLDTHFCNQIYHSLKKEQLNNIQQTPILTPRIATNENANQNIIGLFIISLFLRCHISDLSFCKTFQLDNDEFVSAQKLLNKFFSLKHNELNTTLSGTPFANLFSYLVFTYFNGSVIEGELNFVEAQYKSNVGVYKIVINDYTFILYLKGPHSSFSECLNTNADKVKIAVLPYNQFEILQKLGLREHIKTHKI
jgi:hypothetical protein